MILSSAGRISACFSPTTRRIAGPADNRSASLVYLTRPHFAVLVAFESAVLAANPSPLCVEYEFGPSSP